MPRDGAVTVSDLRGPTLSIVCEPCGRRETYNMARLLERHGDAKLTDLLQALANCPKRARLASKIGAERYSKGFYKAGRLASPICSAAARVKTFLLRERGLAHENRRVEMSEDGSRRNALSLLAASDREGSPRTTALGVFFWRVRQIPWLPVAAAAKGYDVRICGRFVSWRR
jgi:hypothetical protein